MKKSPQAHILHTERLELRPLSLEHLSQDYVDWLNDPDVNLYLETGGDYTFEKLRDFLHDIEEKNIYFWAIHIKENNLHIGNIKLDPIDWDVRKGEVGTLIGEKSFWSKGIGTEAKTAVINYGFKELNLIKVTSGCYGENIKTIRVNEKIGFVIEGIFLKHHLNKHDMRIHDIVRMAIFNPFFESKYE